MNLIKITDNQVVDFAAEELRKYLMMMRPESQTPFIVRACGEGIKLGLMEDFNLDISDCKDKLLDDIVYIDTKGENGIIAGSNPRSVLLAVYEYLRQNGCRWLFPGIDDIKHIIKSGISVRIFPSVISAKMRSQDN